MAKGPVSDAILVNLLFGGRLGEKLREWRSASITPTSPYGSYKRMAELLNAELAEIARKCNAPTRVFHEAAVQRWCNDGWMADDGLARRPA